MGSKAGHQCQGTYVNLLDVARRTRHDITRLGELAIVASKGTGTTVVLVRPTYSSHVKKCPCNKNSPVYSEAAAPLRKQEPLISISKRAKMHDTCRTGKCKYTNYSVCSQQSSKA